MRQSGFLLPLMVLPFLFPAAASNLTRPGASDARELKRSARRMHIGIEQIESTRQTLREAADLALRLESFPEYHSGKLAVSGHGRDLAAVQRSLVSPIRITDSGV